MASKVSEIQRNKKEKGEEEMTNKNNALKLFVLYV